MLNQQLIDSIKEQGALTFEVYMSQALYNEEHGYYASNQADIGKTGDFSTSISIGSLFGQLLAERIYQLWQTIAQPEEKWSIFEIGAFHGQLALDILNHLQAQHPHCYAHCHYHIIEPFEPLQQQQQRNLQPHPRSHWYIDHLQAKQAQNAQQTNNPHQPSTTGIILSNELFDALPVERLIYQNNQWQLTGIDLNTNTNTAPDNNQLTETQLPLSKSPYATEIQNYLKSIEFTPEENYQLEYSPHLNTLTQDISTLIEHGQQIHIDYGYPQEDLHHPQRHQGTLQAYHQQQVITGQDYLNKTGQVDLSCHINFSQLQQSLSNHNWQPQLFIDQSAYLTLNAQSWFEQLSMPPTAEQQLLIKQFHTLTHPSIMGKKFWVLEASRHHHHRPEQPNQSEQTEQNPFNALNKLHYLN